MRRLIAASVLALAAALSAPALSQQQGSWTYAYADGVATATLMGEHNRVSATLTCRPPTGDIIVTDYDFGRAARRVSTAAVRIGNLTVNIPAAVEGRGRTQAVTVHLPQRPPILAGVQPETDQLSVTVNNVVHTYPGKSARQLSDIAYACWQGGS